MPQANRLARTTCPYCGVGCSVDLVTKGDKLVGVQPAMDGPANEGALCVKGQFAFGFVQHNFFILFNALIGLAFWPRAQRELLGR